MTTRETTMQDNRLGDFGKRMFAISGVIGIAGLAISVVIGVTSGDWQRFGRSYLTAYMFVLSLALGGFFFTALHHVTRAGWSVVLRRISEGLASNLTWLWIFFLPIVACMLWGNLYEWNDPAAIAADSGEGGTHLLAHKQPFLNPTFWIILAVVYFVLWAMFSRFFFNNSVAQDSSGDVSLSHRMQRLAPIAIIIYAFSQSYGAIHWMMSLEPRWFSTMYPVYFFAATCCGYFSFQLICMYVLQRVGKCRDEITLEHYQDAGKLLFAFGIVFWAYIAFSQYMLIYYANIPEETGWYLTRQIGGWGVISLLLLVGHFIGPFVILVSKHPKRIKGMIMVIACWMLFMHYIDIYWLVMPRVPTEAIEHASTYGALRDAAAAGTVDVGYGWHVLDLTCLVGLVGVFLAGTAWRMRDCALVPQQDPRLDESLAFENM